MSGTVNISRDIWDDPAFKDQPFTEREAFIWLVMEASWKPRERRVGSAVVSLERGQLAASIRFMADAWNWQKSTVDRFLKRLKKRDMIGTASGTGVNLITICKYDEYQNVPKGSGTPRKRKAGQQRDSSGTNENKGVIRVQEETPKSPSEILASVVGVDAADDFAAFRAEMKKPMSERMAKAMVKQLTGHHDPAAVLNRSIANGWQGIFPDKVKPAEGARNAKSETGAQRAQRIATERAARRMDSGPGDNSVVPLLPAGGTARRG